MLDVRMSEYWAGGELHGERQNKRLAAVVQSLELLTG